MKKMIIKLLVGFVVLSSGISCTRKINTPININQVDKIEIKNKTNSDFQKSTIQLTNKDQVEQIINELNKIAVMKSQPNTKTNYGYFEMEILFNNKSERHFDIINTEFSGIVIVDSDTGVRYKNDELYNIALSLFQQETN